MTTKDVVQLDERMLSAKYVMLLLGISKRTLSRYINDGRLVAVRIGRRKYVPESSVMQFR